MIVGIINVFISTCNNLPVPSVVSAVVSVASVAFVAGVSVAFVAGVSAVVSVASVAFVFSKVWSGLLFAMCRSSFIILFWI